jgi:hypothetical protein
LVLKSLLSLPEVALVVLEIIGSFHLSSPGSLVEAAPSISRVESPRLVRAPTIAASSIEDEYDYICYG